MNIIAQIEREQMDAVLAKRGVPEFGPGDTVKVMVRVVETAEKGDKYMISESEVAALQPAVVDEMNELINKYVLDPPSNETMNPPTIAV